MKTTQRHNHLTFSALALVAALGIPDFAYAEDALDTGDTAWMLMSTALVLMKIQSSRPVVGIPCDHRLVGLHPSQTVGDKYIEAVRQAADATPLLLPSLADPLKPADVFEAVDGLLITGAPSNVHPDRYGGTPPDENMWLQLSQIFTTRSGCMAAKRSIIRSTA